MVCVFVNNTIISHAVPFCFNLADFNECDVDGTCSQNCHNTNGSYHCSCVEGYELKADERGCKALGKNKLELIFSMQKNLRDIWSRTHPGGLCTLYILLQTSSKANCKIIQNNSFKT